jgi:hypothetical protein
MIDCLRATWQALSWRNLLLMEALGQLAIFLQSAESKLFGTWIGHPSEHYLSMLLNVLLIVPIALFADETVKRGARARYVYPAAVFSTIPVALLATIVIQRLYVAVFGIPPGTPDLFWRSSIETGFDMYVYGAFGMLVFMNQRTADRMLENFRNAELRRVQLEQQLVESRLATAEAQVDPAMLFGALTNIKLAFEHDRPDAEEELNDLIQTLRAALARTVAVNDSQGLAR